MDNIYSEDHCTAVASTSSAPVQAYLSELGQHNINNIELTSAEGIVVQIDEGSFILNFT